MRTLKWVQLFFFSLFILIENVHQLLHIEATIHPSQRNALIELIVKWTFFAAVVLYFLSLLALNVTHNYENKIDNKDVREKRFFWCAWRHHLSFSFLFLQFAKFGNRSKHSMVTHNWIPTSATKISSILYRQTFKQKTDSFLCWHYTNDKIHHKSLYYTFQFI